MVSKGPGELMLWDGTFAAAPVGSASATIAATARDGPIAKRQSHGILRQASPRITNGTSLVLEPPIFCETPRQGGSQPEGTLHQAMLTKSAVPGSNQQPPACK